MRIVCTVASMGSPETCVPQPTNKLSQDEHFKNLQVRLMPLTMMSSSGAALSSLAVLNMLGGEGGEAAEMRTSSLCVLPSIQESP